MDTYHENPRYLFSFGMPKLTVITQCHFYLLNTIGSTSFFFFLNKFIYFIYLFLAALGLRCCARAFSSCGEQGLLLPQCTGFSLQWLLLLQSMGSRRAGSVVVALGLQSTGSVVVVHGLSCSAACGILPDQGSNPCPLHWQADSQPLCHQGSPIGSTSNTSIHAVHGIGKNIKFHSLNGTLFFTHVPEKHSGNEQLGFSHFSSQPSYLRTYFKVRPNLGLTTQTIGSSKLQYLLGLFNSYPHS